MGDELRDIALRLGITPYDSRTNTGTKPWKARVKEKISHGVEVEKERYPRAAAIFASRDESHVRRKARQAYRAYKAEEMIHYFPSEVVGDWIRADIPARRGLEIAAAYVQLGSCLKHGIDPLP